MNLVFAELSEGGVLSTDSMTDDEVRVVEIDYGEAAANPAYAVQKIGEMRGIQLLGGGDKHVNEACDRVIDELVRLHDA